MRRILATALLLASTALACVVDGSRLGRPDGEEGTAPVVLEHELTEADSASPEQPPSDVPVPVSRDAGADAAVAIDAALPQPQADAAPPVPDAAPPQLDSGPPVPPAPPATRPIYRSYNARSRDHLLGTVQGEGSPAWAYEFIAFRVLVDQLPNTVPLYRCRIPNTLKHLLSTAADCEGTQVEGVLGFIYAAQAPNTVPISRCWHPNGDHITTTYPSECIAGGYSVEYTHGFAVAP